MTPSVFIVVYDVCLRSDCSDAFSLHCGVGILRLKEGLNFSHLNIGDEGTTFSLMFRSA